MIISITIENWMSFRDEVTFSMVASRERQHGERLPRLNKYRTRILPVSAIYGGNASGKTNFFKALSFTKNLVVDGTRPDELIPVEKFRLDTDCAKKPSRFAFELFINESIYDFSFAVNDNRILNEKLTMITSTSEKVLYDRKDGYPVFERASTSDKFLEFVFRGTRDNQLFLTNSVSQNIEEFKPVYDWFKDNLVLVAPDSRFMPFEKYLDEDGPLYSNMSKSLPMLDTGISNLGGEEIPIDNIPIPEPLKSKLRREVTEGNAVRLLADPINERISVNRKNGELVAKKLVSYHSRSDGAKVKFEMRDESDGSRRVIDLLPAFLELSTRDSTNVYVIDELDRSLHTLLTKELIQAYLSNCSENTRTQLLFTTHDVLLMDQTLLRRDEMWIAERNSLGASTLIPLSDFQDIRYDKDIRKSYLQGRLGGIPQILTGNIFNDR